MKPKKLKRKIIITIDGPAASGKGTAAYILAREYGLLNLDSGACYRAVAWLALENGIDITEENSQKLAELLAANPLKLTPNLTGEGPKCFVHVGKQDITHLIRTPEVGNAASVVGNIQDIRKVVREHEHRIVDQSKVGIIVEGRDSGTVVFPQADIKFFLTAAPEERAARRQAEYSVAGKSLSYDEVLTEIVERDERDTNRAFSALRIPEHAFVVDSTDLAVEQTLTIMRQHIDEYLAGKEPVIAEE